MPKSLFGNPYEAESEDIDRRRRYAEMLREQAGQPLQTNRMVGRVAIPIHPLEGVAQLAKGLSAGSWQKQASEDRKALSGRMQSERSKAIAEALRAGQGTPASSETIMDETAAGGMGQPAQINAPAVPGDPRAAYQRLAQSQDPMLAQMGLQGAMPPIPPQPQPFTLAPGAVRYGPDGKPIASAPQQAPQQAPSNLDRLLRERNALPPGDPRIATYDNAIRKESETAKQISPTIVMPKPDKPDRTPVGYRLKPDGSMEPIPGGPADQKLNAQRPLSATAQKELFEADDVANSAKNAIDILQSIIAKDPKTKMSQNDLAYEGGTANMRRIGMSFVPGQYESENATVDLQNKVTGQALENLRAIFGGMPTEGERKILIELQGSVNQKASQREAIFKRAIDLAQKRMAFAQDKAKKLRGGTYFGAGVATNQDAGSVLDQADAILRGLSGNR